MLLFALINDSRWRERVGTVADELGYEVRWDLRPEGVIATVADARPALIVVDLADETTNWPSMVWSLKTNPATRRLGIIGFASPLSVALRQRAASLLMDEVFDPFDTTSSRYSRPFADRVIAYTRQADADLQASLSSAVDQPLLPLVLKGLKEFNAQDYFEAHESLEHAWMDEDGPIRDMYRGILQVAVAYYHILRGNHRGALKMFLRSVQWLEPLPDVCCGINVAKLREDARRARQHLEELGPNGMSHYDTSLLKPIEFDLTSG